MVCRTFFEALPVDRDNIKQRANLIDQQFPNGVCQLESVSDCSHGIVSDEEYAHRFVFSPIHMDGDVIKTAFFSDCQHVGLSCQRSADGTIDPSVHARGKQIVEAHNRNNSDSANDRSYLGVVTAKCGDVRALKPRPDAGPNSAIFDQPMMAIYDTAKLGDEAHIDIFQLSVDRKKALIKQARRDLALIFTRTPIV